MKFKCPQCGNDQSFYFWQNRCHEHWILFSKGIYRCRGDYKGHRMTPVKAMCSRCKHEFTTEVDDFEDLPNWEEPVWKDT